MDPFTWTVLGGLVAGGGWLYKLKVDKDNLFRKEVRNQVDDLIKMVEEVDVAAHTYFQLAPGDSRCFELANKIRCRVKQIGTRAFHLHSATAPNNLTSLSLRFRQAASGGEFDQVSRVAMNAGDEKLRAISDAARSLIDEAESVFRQRFP